MLSMVAFLLGGCATITPYSGPKSSHAASVTLEASGLVKHAALANDVLFIHLFDDGGSRKLGTIKFTTDHAQENIRVDSGQALILGFMSVQSNFGGYTTCNRDVPFVADDSSQYIVAYSTTKTACTIRISKLSSTGSLTLLSEVAGVVSGMQFNVSVRASH